MTHCKEADFCYILVIFFVFYIIDFCFILYGFPAYFEFHLLIYIFIYWQNLK